MKNYTNRDDTKKYEPGVAKPEDQDKKDQPEKNRTNKTPTHTN